MGAIRYAWRGEETYALRSTISNVCRKLNDNQEPGFNVKKSLAALVPLELVTLDASHVLFHPLESLLAVGLAEKPGLCRFVREEGKYAE